MKKICFICTIIILITSACNLFTPNNEEKFVNPLFYKQLIPISSIARETYLTPNSLKFSNSTLYSVHDNHKNGWITQSCILQENKKDYIILKCKFYNPVIPKMQTDIMKFQITECRKSVYCNSYRWLVELIEYDKSGFRRSGEIYGIE